MVDYEDSVFFTPGKSAGAETDINIETEIGSHDIIAEQAGLLTGFYSLFQSFDRQRIFGADIKPALSIPGYFVRFHRLRYADSWFHSYIFHLLYLLHYKML